MNLRDLLANAGDARIRGDATIEMEGLAYDSRKVRPGDLFFSTARDAAQGRANIADALNRGARALVVADEDEVEARSAATVIVSSHPRRLMGVVASRFFDAPSRRIKLIGITGTSGKTTTTYLLASIFAAAGWPHGIIGTIGIFSGGQKLYSGLTTPESIDFEAALATMERSGVRAAAAEISSIGLEERRVDELNFSACLFTNLSRDHLDYHGTVENYFAAKLRLFTELLPKSADPEAVAVVNGDDPFGRRVLQSVRGRKLSFGLDKSCDVHPVSFSTGLNGIRAVLSIDGKRLEICSPLLGRINLLNILGASALSVALGIDGDAVIDGVRRCPGAPGRLEAVTGPADVKVLVDYAHKPDALQAVLDTLRELRPRRLICVFGCGGDRDRGKRPIMGEIAGRVADLPILTSDNPRTEDPLSIIAEVENGLKQTALKRIDRSQAQAAGGYLVEPDRREAIALGLGVARAGDIVVIAGKGHEDYQLVGGRRLDFDDRKVVRELTASVNKGAERPPGTAN
jgi:UDP-N-acetylmuramoyl-L-alanyl-D-glutamate--2,6-diaminopimelate ligase